MDKKENGFSLVVVVIFMSIAALFIGYLMGSWLISFLIEDDAEIAEQEQNITQVNQQVVENNQDNSQEEAAVINNTENNLTAPPEEAGSAQEEENNNTSENTTVVEQNQNQNQNTAGSDNNSSENPANKSGFGVQIGAFANYNNALSVKDKVLELGFEVVITDSSPHQVQVIGYESRDQAESAAQELEAEGYPGFIVIRE